MKRFILSAAVAVATVTGTGSLAQAATPIEPASAIYNAGTPDGHHCDEYHVMYYDCSCGHWKCYGVYDSRCHATPVAKKLARAGYRVRIDVETV